MSQIGTEQSLERESLDITVGRRVHMLMWEQRITQTSLGRIVGMDQSGLGKRLRGERGWSLDDVRSVAAALNVSIASLLEDPQDGHPSDQWDLSPRHDSNVRQTD